MYQENLPSTEEIVDVYADNIPATEGTMLDVALPVRKQHFEVKKNDLFTSTLNRPGLKKIYDPENRNDVIDVIMLKPVIKVEDGKIDIEKDFELILERPMEPVSESANKVIFNSEEPEIIDVAEDGSLSASVKLGQTYVTVEWPSGVIAQVLVTIGEVSEVKPAEPVLGGDIVEPEAPEQGGEEPEQPVDPNPEPEPEPEDPETPVEPEVKEANIMYGLMPIADHMESIDAITAEDLAAVEYTKVEVAAMEKTNIPVKENDILVILIPADSELVATRDNGVGTKEAFMEDIIGCNGQKTYTIDGIEYKLYAEFQTVGATGYYFYVD